MFYFGKIIMCIVLFFLILVTFPFFLILSPLLYMYDVCENYYYQVPLNTYKQYIKIAYYDKFIKNWVEEIKK